MDALLQGQPELTQRIKPLVNARRNFDNGFGSQRFAKDSLGDVDAIADGQLDTMPTRLRQLEDRLRVRLVPGKRTLPGHLRLSTDKPLFEQNKKALMSNAATQSEKNAIDIDLDSWPLVRDWKPCPIGMLPGGRFPNLDWQS